MMPPDLTLEDCLDKLCDLEPTKFQRVRMLIRDGDVDKISLDGHFNRVFLFVHGIKYDGSPHWDDLEICTDAELEDAAADCLTSAIQDAVAARGWDWVMSSSRQRSLTHVDIKGWGGLESGWPVWSVGEWAETPVLAMARTFVAAIQRSLEPEPEDGPPDGSFEPMAT